MRLLGNECWPVGAWRQHSTTAAGGLRLGWRATPPTPRCMRLCGSAVTSGAHQLIARSTGCLVTPGGGAAGCSPGRPRPSLHNNGRTAGADTYAAAETLLPIAQMVQSLCDLLRPAAGVRLPARRCRAGAAGRAGAEAAWARVRTAGWVAAE
jgi:hypothetical protein